jgi:hypothetical protein
MIKLKKTGIACSDTGFYFIDVVAQSSGVSIPVLSYLVKAVRMR